MLQVIRKQLVRIIKDIDAGNTNMTEAEMIKTVKFLQAFNSREKYMSKYQAYTYLGISRPEFDNRVREGIIPKGIKVEGFKELHWKEKDIKQLKNKDNE